MKILLAILLWVSIGVGGVYSTRVSILNRELKLGHVLMGGAFGPITLILLASVSIETGNDCLANCK